MYTCVCGALSETDVISLGEKGAKGKIGTCGKCSGELKRLLEKPKENYDENTHDHVGCSNNCSSDKCVRAV